MALRIEVDTLEKIHVVFSKDVKIEGMIATKFEFRSVEYAGGGSFQEWRERVEFAV